MIYYIGETDSKRRKYFELACSNLNVQASFIDYDSELSNLEGTIKIDPIDFKTSEIFDNDQCIKKYFDLLCKVKSNEKLISINNIDAIMIAYNKKKTKELLCQHNIKTPEQISERFNSLEEILVYLSENNVRKIFIKPNYGAGAQGIVALNFNRRTNDVVIYTTIKVIDNTFYNTKNVRRISKKEEIKLIIDTLLLEDILIEKWITKETYNNYSYDLRVVYQFGKLEKMIGRLSKSPITNLHINNLPISIEELNINEEIVDEITKVCKMLCDITKLNVLSLDVLIKKATNEVYVLEINSHGDFIQSDAYNENTIYTNQVKWMVQNEK